MRKIHQEYYKHLTVKVFRDSRWNEYVVKLYDFTLLPKAALLATYHTDRKDDALCTAGNMLYEAARKITNM